MKRAAASAILSLSVASFAAFTWTGTALADELDVDISSCGHLEEMAAGRRALVEGDKQEALTHFRAAREILLECERRAEADAERTRTGREV